MTPKCGVGEFGKFVFQYRKRYEITCDDGGCSHYGGQGGCFNTASGMRSHVTWVLIRRRLSKKRFQYRKRYEITCDAELEDGMEITLKFQYRKRYEITCDFPPPCEQGIRSRGFNTASGMRSHVTCRALVDMQSFIGFNTASGMRSHVTRLSPLDDR